MSWAVDLPEDDRPSFDRIQIEEVLYFYDHPLIFSGFVGKKLVVSVLIDELDSGNIYLVSPTNHNIIENLKNGIISVRSAFSLNWLWFALCDVDFNVEKTWSTSSDKIGDDFLPARNVGLHPHFGSVPDNSPADVVADPFLGVHFSGGDLGNAIPFMDFKTIIDHTYSSLRTLFTNAFADQIKNQRITEGLVNRVLQMPLREPRFASLSLELERPVLNFSRVRKTLEIDREEVSESFDRLNENFLTSVADLSTSLEKSGRISVDYEIGRLLNEILPDQKSRYDSLAIYGKSRKNRFVFNRDQGNRIKEEFDIVSENTRKIVGRVVELNIPSKTFLLEGKMGSITTCQLHNDLWLEYFERLRRVNGYPEEIAVHANIQTRKRRALADVERIEF